MKKKHLLISALVFAFFSVGSFAVIEAQEGGGNGFRVSPVRVEPTIEPGKSETIEIRAQNPSDSRVAAQVVVNDFEAATDESGQPRVIFESDQSAPGNSFKSLVGDLGQVEIEGNGEVTIPVEITVPEGASPGGYYGAVRLEPINESDKNLNLAASVGTLFLVTVPGNITESLELIEISAAKSGNPGRFFIDSGDNMQVVTRIFNNGNIHTKPFGRIQITNSSGEIVEDYEFNNLDPRSNVLPDSSRKFVDELDYSNFFGKYTITANFGYGNGGNLITATNTFWVIPLWLVVVAIVAVIAVVVGAFLVYNKLKGSRKHKVKPRR